MCGVEHCVAIGLVLSLMYTLVYLANLSSDDGTYNSEHSLSVGINYQNFDTLS